MATQDPVVDLVFSTDGRQLYDLRSSHANVWEPTILVELAEPASRQSDGDSDTYSMPAKAPVGPPQVSYFRVDPITALKAQEQKGLFCLGTRTGRSGLYRLSGGNLSELGQTQNSSIQQIAWNDAGDIVCYADISRTIHIDSVQQESQLSRHKPDHILDLTIREMKNNIEKILLHPTSNKTLIANRTTSVIVSLQKKTVTAVREHEVDIAGYGRWIRCAGENDELLLYVSPWHINIYDWDSLNIKSVYSLDSERSRYFAHGNPQDDEHITAKDNFSISSPELNNLAVQDLILSPSNRHLLIQASDADGHAFFRLLRIYKDQGFQTKDLNIPSELVHRLDHPLRFLTASGGADRLVFLDCNSWLCTWEVSEGGPVNITTHYCLPGDWVSPDCIALVELLSDGTLLCPRNGEVAIVRCTSII